MTSSKNAQNAFCDASSRGFPSRPAKNSDSWRPSSPDVISVVRIGAGRDSNRSSPIPVLPAVSLTAACSVRSVDDNADTAWAFEPSFTTSRPYGTDSGVCRGSITAVSVSPRAGTYRIGPGYLRTRLSPTRRVTCRRSMCSSRAKVYFRLVLNSSRTSEIVTSPLSRANSTTRLDISSYADFRYTTSSLTRTIRPWSESACSNSGSTGASVGGEYGLEPNRARYSSARRR